MRNTLFPVFLKTEHLRFLIVGGGKIGLEKTNTLLRQNPQANITVVAPEIHPDLSEVILWSNSVRVVEREFKATDLNNADIVIIATNNGELNRHIKALANAQSLLVNAADQPELCDFYLSSIVNKGSLKMAISTNGRSPVMARRLREYFEHVIPEAIETSIEKLDDLRKVHTGDLAAKLSDLNKATASLSPERVVAKRNKRLVWQISLLFVVLVLGYGLSTVISGVELEAYASAVPGEFYEMLLVGFFAQLVDGALGMGFGIMCATTMMLLGVKLPAISGSIHTAEVFSSAVSGYTHYRFGNVNKKLLFWLALPGVLGAIAGAILLIYLGKKYESFAYGIVAIYTMFIGVRLVLLAISKARRKTPVKNVGVLGLFGGFMDSFAGGGWGPIVTSTLLAKGRKINFVVGTVSLAEFFVTLAAALAYFASLGLTHWHVIVGLILGSTAAAPLAARLSGRLPRRTAFILVAILVITFSIRVLLKL